MGPYVWGQEEHTHRMLKKARHLTHPTPARQDAPFRGKAAASDPRWFFQASSCTFPMMAQMSPPLRASNEGLLRPRVARAQGTHWVIPPADGFFQHPASERLISHRLIEPSQHRGGQRKLRLYLDARRH
jgi:hypothetical protein